MDWIKQPQDRASRWEHAEQDWKEALERANGNERVALGLLLARAHDRLEELQHAVAKLERDPSS